MWTTIISAVFFALGVAGFVKLAIEAWRDRKTALHSEASIKLLLREWSAIKDKKSEVIRVRDFTLSPAIVLKADGLCSAEEFREEWLVPALLRCKKVIIELDGTLGYSSTWLEEVFGKLTSDKLSIQDIQTRLDIRSLEDESLVREAWFYVVLGHNPHT